MTADDRLRALERRWRETGDRADEGALLLERVRLGLLDRAKLELAAFSAHEGARRALEEQAWPPDLPTTIAGLERWGVTAVEAATIAMLRAVLDGLALEVPPPAEGTLALGREVIDALAASFTCPCTPHWSAGWRLIFRARSHPELNLFADEGTPVRGTPAERLPGEVASCARVLEGALRTVDAPTLLRRVRAALVELALGA